ncbi:MAG TPA: hypothetical protein PKG92_03075 [Anaerolineaceae bacterium]|nr:hypothetical protein [Anaerolineaceae bacterium]
MFFTIAPNVSTWAASARGAFCLWPSNVATSAPLRVRLVFTPGMALNARSTSAVASSV